MAADVNINSLDLLSQYQTHLRNFSNCVDLGVVAYRDHLRKLAEKKNDQKCEIERIVSAASDQLDTVIREHEDLVRRYEFCEEDEARICQAIERIESQKHSLSAQADLIMEKIEHQLGVLDDMVNLTYSYGNRAREMSDSANGSLSGIIRTISNYQKK